MSPDAPIVLKAGPHALEHLRVRECPWQTAIPLARSPPRLPRYVDRFLRDIKNRRSEDIDLRRPKRKVREDSVSSVEIIGGDEDRETRYRRAIQNADARRIQIQNLWQLQQDFDKSDLHSVAPHAFDKEGGVTKEYAKSLADYTARQEQEAARKRRELEERDGSQAGSRQSESSTVPPDQSAHDDIAIPALGQGRSGHARSSGPRDNSLAMAELRTRRTSGGRVGKPGRCAPPKQKGQKQMTCTAQQLAAWAKQARERIPGRAAPPKQMGQKQTTRTAQQPSVWAKQAREKRPGQPVPSRPRRKKQSDRASQKLAVRHWQLDICSPQRRQALKWLKKRTREAAEERQWKEWASEAQRNVRERGPSRSPEPVPPFRKQKERKKTKRSSTGRHGDTRLK